MTLKPQYLCVIDVLMREEKRTSCRLIRNDREEGKEETLTGPFISADLGCSSDKKSWKLAYEVFFLSLSLSVREEEKKFQLLPCFYSFRHKKEKGFIVNCIETLMSRS